MVFQSKIPSHCVHGTHPLLLPCPPPALRRGEIKILQKSLLWGGVRNFNFGAWGGGGSHNFEVTGLRLQIKIAWSVFTGLINWRGLHLSHIWTIHLYGVLMLRFVLCLLYFFRFHFLYIYQELCWMRGLCISFPCFLFPVGGAVKNLRTRGLKDIRTGRVTDLRGGVFLLEEGGGSVPH